MSSKWRKFLWIVISIVTLTIGVRVYFVSTDDFRISNIKYDMPFHPEWEISSLSAEEQARLDSILQQKFHYIGKGAQSYVFGSDDNKYVIKFFKFKHLRPSLFVDMLPEALFSSYKQKVAARKDRKLHGVFTGYKLAYDLDKANSGLIFIQLNPSHKDQEITVIDKIGLSRSINLGEIPFIIQEKGDTLRTVLKSLLDKENTTVANNRIEQILDLYVDEYQKGIFDHDHGVMHNTGFVEDRPIHLDVGKMHKDDTIKQPRLYQEDLRLIVTKMTKWLESSYPKHAQELSENIENKLAQISKSNAN